MMGNARRESGSEQSQDNLPSFKIAESMTRTQQQDSGDVQNEVQNDGN
jgi:hypothetical protein